MNFRKLMIPAVILVTLFANVAFAQTEEADAAPAEEESSAGVNVDFGIATAYNFRGLNVFAENSPQDRKPAFFPSITKSFGDTGLYLGYWGAFQINGTNRGDVVAGALGHEQDVYVGWDKSFGPSDMLTFSAALTYFFYPFAEDDDVKLPSYLEPLVGFSVGTFVDLGVTVSYFAGLDDLTKPYSHLYIKPSVGKSFSFGDKLGLDLGFGAGFKVWNDDETDAGGNTVDLAFDVAVPIAVAGSFYVAPSIQMVWTNLEGDITEDSGTVDADGNPIMTTVREMNAGDQGFIVGAINFGADF